MAYHYESIRWEELSRYLGAGSHQEGFFEGILSQVSREVLRTIYMSRIVTIEEIIGKTIIRYKSGVMAFTDGSWVYFSTTKGQRVWAWREHLCWPDIEDWKRHELLTQEQYESLEKDWVKWFSLKNKREEDKYREMQEQLEQVQLEGAIKLLKEHGMQVVD